MATLEQLIEGLNCTGLERELITSLLKDFLDITAQIDKLKKYPRYKINDKDPTKQIKLPVHEMLKDLQAQKNDIATKLLKAIGKDGEDDNALEKILEGFKNA